MVLNSKQKWCVVFLASLLVFLGLAFDIKYTSGTSMLPTCTDGEPLLVFRLAYGLSGLISNCPLNYARVKKGDVVLFRLADKFIVKRVALASCDELRVCKQDGCFFLQLENLYLKLTPENYLTLTGNGLISFVPDGFVLVLGDMLSESYDSRVFGFVAEKNIIGKVLFK